MYILLINTAHECLIRTTLKIKCPRLHFNISLLVCIKYNLISKWTSLLKILYLIRIVSNVLYYSMTILIIILVHHVFSSECLEVQIIADDNIPLQRFYLSIIYRSIDIVLAPLEHYDRNMWQVALIKRINKMIKEKR